MAPDSSTAEQRAAEGGGYLWHGEMLGLAVSQCIYDALLSPSPALKSQ